MKNWLNDPKFGCTISSKYLKIKNNIVQENDLIVDFNSLKKTNIVCCFGVQKWIWLVVWNDFILLAKGILTLEAY